MTGKAHDRTVVIATRRSPLARTQTDWVADRLRAAGLAVETLELVTTGDRWSASGSTEATRGLFVKELEEALLDGRADLAVHSAKDLPVDLPPGLDVVAVPEREDPRDVLVGVPDGLTAVTPGARVGTGSARRAAQIRRARPDLECVEIRGNVGTRLDKLARGDADALVLAAAGLNRLGLDVADAVPLSLDDCVPAAGQGALALEGRRGDPVADAVAAAIDHADTRRCLAIERDILRGLGGGCREPIGVHAQPGDDGLVVRVFAATEDHSRQVRETVTLRADDDVTVVVTALVARITDRLS